MTSSPAPIAIGGTARRTWWAWTVATFFGAGFGKPGPGTWGSIAAVLIWAAVAWGLHPAALTLFVVLLVGIALALILGVPAATIAAREAGRHDPGFRSEEHTSELQS